MPLDEGKYATLILPYVYLSTVLYLLSVVTVVMFDTVTILLHVSAHIDVYHVTVYSPVD